MGSISDIFQAVLDTFTGFVGTGSAGATSIFNTVTGSLQGVIGA